MSIMKLESTKLTYLNTGQLDYHQTADDALFAFPFSQVCILLAK